MTTFFLALLHLRNCSNRTLWAGEKYGLASLDNPLFADEGCGGCYELEAVLLWRTSAPRTQKMTSSAMLVAWSPTRSRLREMIRALSDCGVRSGFSLMRELSA